MPSEVSSPLVAATTSDLSRSWFIVLSYGGPRRSQNLLIGAWSLATLLEFKKIERQVLNDRLQLINDLLVEGQESTDVPGSSRVNEDLGRIG
jgi:hypothetical protein